MKAAAVLVALAFALAAPFTLAQEQDEQKPAEKQDELGAKIDKLIEKLGSDSFKERESATEELRKIGKPAAPALKEALKSDDPEVRWRAESVLKSIRKRGSQPPKTEPESKRPGRPRLEEELKGMLEGLPPEQRKAIEDMLKRLEELEKDFDFPKRLPPFPGDEDEDNFLPDAVRKAFEDMQKRMEESRRRFDRFRKRLDKPLTRKAPEEPDPEPRGEKETEKKQAPQPVPGSKGRATVVLKRLTWKDGKLIEEEERRYNSALRGLFVIDGGQVLQALRYHLELGEKEGVLVESIEKGSPFDAAGIRKHDIITKVGGQAVDSGETLARLLEGKDRVAVEIVRRGERKTIEVILEGKDETPEKDK